MLCETDLHGSYWAWSVHKLYLLLGTQEITAEFVVSFKDFPPPRSFNLDIAGDPPRFARDWHDLDQRRRIGCDRCYQGVQARRWGSRGVLP
jgi:hypothetical protein